MNVKKIEYLLINKCGYKSIENAKRNYKSLNFYPLIGELDAVNNKNIKQK